MTIDEIKAKLAEFVTLQEQIKALTKQKDLIKDQIKSEMGDTLYLQAGNYAAVIVPQDRKSLNAELIAQEFRAEGKDIPEHWWKIVPVDRFTVKEVARRANRRKAEASDSASGSTPTSKPASTPGISEESPF